MPFDSHRMKSPILHYTALNTYTDFKTDLLFRSPLKIMSEMYYVPKPIFKYRCVRVSTVQVYGGVHNTGVWGCPQYRCESTNNMAGRGGAERGGGRGVCRGRGQGREPGYQDTTGTATDGPGKEGTSRINNRLPRAMLILSPVYIMAARPCCQRLRSSLRRRSPCHPQ